MSSTSIHKQPNVDHPDFSQIETDLNAIYTDITNTQNGVFQMLLTTIEPNNANATLQLFFDRIPKIKQQLEAIKSRLTFSEKLRNCIICTGTHKLNTKIDTSNFDYIHKKVKELSAESKQNDENQINLKKLTQLVQTSFSLDDVKINNTAQMRVSEFRGNAINRLKRSFKNVT